MHAFLVRSAVIIILIFTGAFLAAFTEKHFLAIPVWFTAIAVWTLHLGFRQALFIVIPFLLILDTLWDGKLGALFLFGFVLATATTYIVVRIEEQSSLLQNGIYSVLISICATGAVFQSLWTSSITSVLTELSLISNTFLWVLLTVLIVLPLEKRVLIKVENWLDTSYREQVQKIR